MSTKSATIVAGVNATGAKLQVESAIRLLELLDAVQEELDDGVRTITAGLVREGQHFWEKGDKRGGAPFHVKKVTNPGRSCPGMVHLKTTRGDWCIRLETQFEIRS